MYGERAIGGDVGAIADGLGFAGVLRVVVLSARALPDAAVAGRIGVRTVGVGAVDDAVDDVDGLRDDVLDTGRPQLRAGERRPEAVVPMLDTLRTVRMSASSSSKGWNSQLSKSSTRRAASLSMRICDMTLRTLSMELNTISSV